MPFAAPPGQPSSQLARQPGRDVREVSLDSAWRGAPDGATAVFGAHKSVTAADIGRQDGWIAKLPLLAPHFSGCFSIRPEPMALENAMEHAEALAADAAEQLARLRFGPPCPSGHSEKNGNPTGS
jgi:hypothetical protein